MTAEEFEQWIQDMVLANMIREEYGHNADIEKLLGVTKNTVLKYKAEGCDRRTALACSALVMGLGPYPDVK